MVTVLGHGETNSLTQLPFTVDKAVEYILSQPDAH